MASRSGIGISGRADSPRWQGVGGRDPIFGHTDDSNGLLRPNEAVFRSSARMALWPCAVSRAVVTMGAKVLEIL